MKKILLVIIFAAIMNCGKEKTSEKSQEVKQEAFAKKTEKKTEEIPENERLTISDSKPIIYLEGYYGFDRRKNDACHIVTANEVDESGYQAYCDFKGPGSAISDTEIEKWIVCEIPDTSGDKTYFLFNDKKICEEQYEAMVVEKEGQADFEANKQKFHNIQYDLQNGKSIAAYLDDSVEIEYLRKDRCSGTMSGKITIKAVQLENTINIPVKQTKDGWMENCAKDINSVGFDFYKLAKEAVQQGGKFSPMGSSAGYELEGHNSVLITLYAYNYMINKIEYKLEDPG